MEPVTRLVLTLLVLAIAFRSGDAVLKCYQCNTMTDSKCQDPFMKDNDLQPAECTLAKLQQMATSMTDALGNFGSKMGLDIGGGATPPEVQWTCVKMDYTTAKGEKHVLRGCQMPKSDSFDPCQMKDDTNKQSFCGSCEGDACNGAQRLNGISQLFYLLVPCLVALKAIAA